MPQIITLTSILGHLGELGGLGTLQEGVGGGFSEARALVLFLNVLNWSLKEVLGGGLMIF